MVSSLPLPGVALTTVYFFKGELPTVLALRDAALPLKGDCPGAFAALHGNRGKREGLMAARQHADRTGLKYTVIDFLLETRESTRYDRLSFEDIASQSVIFLDRLTRAGLEELYALMERRAGPLQLQRGKHFRQEFEALIQARPELLSVLFDDEAMAHVIALVYPGKPIFSERPTSIALVAQRHWERITEAACRLDPTTLVLLDTPDR